jgi:hypothetical protein
MIGAYFLNTVGLLAENNLYLQLQLKKYEILIQNKKVKELK